MFASRHRIPYFSAFSIENSFYNEIIRDSAENYFIIREFSFETAFPLQFSRSCNPILMCGTRLVLSVPEIPDPSSSEVRFANEQH